HGVPCSHSRCHPGCISSSWESCNVPPLYILCKTPPAAWGGVPSKGKSKKLELHGQHFLFAAPVVDAVDLIEVLLVPGHVDAHGPPFPVDGQRVGLVQAGDKTAGVVLAMVQLYKADHTLDRFGPKGLGIATACKNRSAAPASPPCFIHRMRSAQLPGGHDHR